MSTPVLERLESRITPAATTALNPITNVLTVTGDFAGEHLDIVQDELGNVEIFDVANGNTSLGTFNLVRGIVYVGQDADDKVTITASKVGLAEGLTITDQAGTNEFTVTGGNANVGVIKKVVSLNGGGGNDTFRLQNLSLSKGLNVSGLGGDDTLNFDDNVITGPIKVVTTENITGANIHLGTVTVDAAGAVGNTNINILATTLAGPLKITGGAFDDTIAVMAATKGAVTIVTGNGTNTVTLQSDDGRVAPTVTGGTGDDTVHLDGFWSKGATLSLGDGDNNVRLGSNNDASAITGAVKITTGIGSDTVSLFSKRVDDGQGNISVFAGLVGSLDLKLGAGDNTMTSPDAFLVTGTLSLTTGAGADNFSAASLRVGGKMTLGLGDGDNTTSLTQCRLTGGLAYTGGLGLDTLTASAVSEAAFSVTAGNGNNELTLELYSTAAITINCGTGQDVVSVNGRSTSSLTINLGAGDETLTFGGLYGTVTIDGGTGVETLTDNGTFADKITAKNIL